VNPLKLLLGVVGGAIVGAALGMGFAMAVGLYSKWANPSDPSAGSVAIIVIFTAPVGLFLGALVGLFVGFRWM
jgi:hypothetical protein